MNREQDERKLWLWKPEKEESGMYSEFNRQSCRTHGHMWEVQ